MLPSRGWQAYQEVIRGLGEYRSGLDTEHLEFLESLGLVGAGHLTEPGEHYFRLKFIEQNEEAAVGVLRHQILTTCPEAGAICQMLANRPRVARGVAETVLRSQGYGEELTDRRLGSLLALLDHTSVIAYARRQGCFRVLTPPLTQPELPSSIFIAPDTPWSNRQWLHRLLSDCRGRVLWLDKHFLPEGLDFLGAAVNGADVTDVRVLSLALPENETRRAKRSYRDLARELQSRTTTFEWRFIDNANVRDTHDRWIMSDRGAWNVPNLNAILSGQHSELTTSTNTAELRKMFEAVWAKAPPRPADVSAICSGAPTRVRS
jgi:hypothetical protein